MEKMPELGYVDLFPSDGYDSMIRLLCFCGQSTCMQRVILEYVGRAFCSENPPGTGQVFVNTLNGATTTIKVENEWTHLDFKEMVRETVNIPADQQRLIWAGSQLEENRTLANYNTRNESTLYLLLRLHEMISTFTSTNDTDPLIHFLTSQPFLGDQRPFVSRPSAGS